ncbi:Ferric reductase like transmembrane component [Pichia californica]|uniref:Probable metalloreductase AIM14 n=1 Tax=Pichia californica TaxID=460514 RepID=A0A9P6WM86_9ASCO|nr:Ferric reductase like transmembrane component [[Candida] californica]KAG0688618.1 Ferric reductase like transmembrane component [[Candida] californica]
MSVVNTKDIDDWTDSVNLVKRHGQFHTVNIKYGYIIFGLSILFISIRTLSLWFYQRSWKKSGRSTSFLNITSLPLPLSISLLTLVVAILMVINPHFEKISVSIKRLGRLSYALVPLDIFLAARPSWFSIDNYVNTIILHKWVSRLIVVLGILHSIGFLIYYAQVGTFNKVFKLVNFLGVTVFSFSVFMMIFWKPIRNYNYQLFYIYHNFFMILFVVLIFFHARPGVTFYSFINIILLFVGLLKKYIYAKNITMTEIIENPESDLIIVKFPKGLLPESYVPGCHVRIGYNKLSPLFLLTQSHPYTVASTFENRDLLASLVIKKTKFKLEPFETYSIQTNFNSSLNVCFFNSVDNVCIVCGGSGISLGLGIFEYLKRCIIAEGRDIKMKFIWVTSKEEDAFILQELGIQGVDVFISDHSTDGYEVIEDNNEENIPLTDLSNHSQDSLNSFEHKFSNTVVIGKRPKLEAMLVKNLSKTIDYANKWIISCGPTSMNEDCALIAKKQKCRFFSEEYAF